MLVRTALNATDLLTSGQEFPGSGAVFNMLNIGSSRERLYLTEAREGNTPFNIVNSYSIL